MIILPPKIHSLNYHVKEFNNLILDMSCSHKRVHVIEHYSTFSGIDGCLDDMYGRFKDGRANPTDALHLGKNGIRRLSKSIKSSIMGSISRSKSRFGGDYQTAANRGHVDGYQPPS